MKEVNTEILRAIELKKILKHSKTNGTLDPAIFLECVHHSSILCLLPINLLEIVRILRKYEFD